MNALAWATRLVVLLPVLAALAGLFVRRGRRAAAGLLAVGGTLGALLAAGFELAIVGGSPLTGIGLLGAVPTGAGSVDLSLRADRLSALVAVMVTVVALCVQVYSTASQKLDSRYRAYAATVSLFTSAMLLVVQADDLLLLLVGWEVMGLCSYLLVGHDSERAAARRAAVKAFLTTRVGDVGFVLGIVVLLAGAGTSSIHVLLRPETLAALPGTTRTTVVLLLLAGVVGKSAQFPLHTWLPDAMEGPTPVSALIHAATMVAAGGYVLARLLPLVDTAPVAKAALAVTASVSMLGAALAALAQSDLKRVLAWSTISQVAYLLGALAVLPVGASAAPGVAQLLSHAGFKALLFLAAGAFAYQLRTTELSRMAGCGRRAPLVAVTFTLGLGSLAGLPPLSGFWSKEAVLGAAQQAAASGSWAGWLVLVTGLVTGVVTAAYATRTFVLVVPGPAQVDDPSPARVPIAMSAPLVLLAVPAVGGGLLVLDRTLTGPVHLSVATGTLATVLALLGVAGSLLLARRHHDPLRALHPLVRNAFASGFGVDTVIRRLVVRPVWALARLVAAGDRDVVDAYVRGAAAAARVAGAGLRRTQTGGTTGYLTWLAVGALVAALAGVGMR